MLSAFSSSAVFHIPLPLCALGLFMWQSEIALTYLIQCIGWIRLWFLFLKSCTIQLLPVRGAAVVHLLRCTFSEETFQNVSLRTAHFLHQNSAFRFPAVPCRQLLMTMKKLHQHWCTPSGTENTCHFKEDQAEAPGEQCSCFQRRPLPFTNLSVHPATARGTALWKHWVTQKSNSKCSTTC